MVKIEKYEVWIEVGGLMEDVEFHVEDKTTIEAISEDEALKIWLDIHNCHDTSYLHKGANGKGWSYYYPIICKKI